MRMVDMNRTFQTIHDCFEAEDLADPIIQEFCDEQGNPFFQIDLEAFVVLVFKADNPYPATAPAEQIILMVIFEGYALLDPLPLLVENYENSGLPHFGLTPEGTITLQATVPVRRGYPRKIVQEQCLACFESI